MKIATWNVNSLKVRLPQVLQWLETNPIDVLCLQETKLTDNNFPSDELEKAGYQTVFAGQKTYNGVAILSRHEIKDVVRNNPLFDDEQQRIIAATVGDTRIINAYVPNGQEIGSEKYAYKLQWLDAFHDWITDECAKHPSLALVGDFNIAPEDQDVYDPVAWQGHVLVSGPERAAFRRLQQLGLKDAFRLFEQPENTYSWWDYRQLGFQKNRGLRIDLILLSEKLAQNCSACSIDRDPRKWTRPSDHAPVIATLG